ncbi:PAS domain-containing protein [Maribacter litopenaei]|uniref:histidine kinase n=1 Tax=Maribacter litopenaei TaxID=2976127 RepID=A0ABY5Y8H6_9FLAO|nr:PAS domain-containing protein [Maribacter litopenaei]UWX54765.1 PAS domain-containing protein [Maribacter litopenaei]
MNTLPSNYTLKHFPIPTAILNRELKIIDYSDTFTIHFAEKKDFKGKEIIRVIEELPPQLHTDLRKSLQGTTAIQNDNHKFFLKTNKPKWLKWNINPWQGNEGTIDGIILVLEDVSDFMREQELLLKAERVSKTGSWELNLITNEIYWSPMTKLMHEVPLDFLPVLEEGLNFFKEGDSRDRIALSVSNAIADGKPYDEELVLITSKGNEVWVRAKGEPEMVHGKCVRLFGTIQDIDKEKKAELKYLETSERLQIATAVANIGIWELYLDENIVICNDNMYDIYGLSKDSSNILEDWLKRIHPKI